MTIKEEIRNTIIWCVGAIGLSISNIYELTTLQTVFESLYGVVIILGLIILTLLSIGLVKGNEELMEHIEATIKKDGADKYIYSKTERAVKWTFTILTCLMFAYFGYGLLLTGYVIVTIESLFVLYILKDFAMVYKHKEDIENGTKSIDDILNL